MIRIIFIITTTFGLAACSKVKSSDSPSAGFITGNLNDHAQGNEDDQDKNQKKIKDRLDAIEGKLNVYEQNLTIYRICLQNSDVEGCKSVADAVSLLKL